MLFCCCVQFWTNLKRNALQQLLGHLPPIWQTIDERRSGHAGPCWRSKNEIIRNVLTWTPTLGQTHIKNLLADTVCRLEDLTSTRINRSERWMRVMRIGAIGPSSKTMTMMMMMLNLLRDWIKRLKSTFTLINRIFYEPREFETNNVNGLGEDRNNKKYWNKEKLRERTGESFRRDKEQIGEEYIPRTEERKKERKKEIGLT